jgi:hypothetical protein
VSNLTKLTDPRPIESAGFSNGADISGVKLGGYFHLKLSALERLVE